MSDLITAIQKAIADICAARLCEVNSMSSRQEMLRLMIQATDTLRAALEQQEPEPGVCGRCGGLVYDPVVQQEQEPVAWRTFDGEGGYDYRTYDGNENYCNEWDKRNPNHKGWVEPLFINPPRRETEQGQPEQEPVAWLRRDELADLQTCNYRRLGADSPRIWAPHQPDSPEPALDLVAVYTHPPRREWRSLSEGEILPLYNTTPSSHAEMLEFALAVEAALKSL